MDTDVKTLCFYTLKGDKNCHVEFMYKWKCERYNQFLGNLLKIIISNMSLNLFLPLDVENIISMYYNKEEYIDIMFNINKMNIINGNKKFIGYNKIYNNKIVKYKHKKLVEMGIIKLYSITTFWRINSNNLYQY